PLRGSRSRIREREPPDPDRAGGGGWSVVGERVPGEAAALGGRGAEAIAAGGLHRCRRSQSRECEARPVRLLEAEAPVIGAASAENGGGKVQPWIHGAADARQDRAPLAQRQRGGADEAVPQAVARGRVERERP